MVRQINRVKIPEGLENSTVLRTPEEWPQRWRGWHAYGPAESLLGKNPFLVSVCSLQDLFFLNQEKGCQCEVIRTPLSSAISLRFQCQNSEFKVRLQPVTRQFEYKLILVGKYSKPEYPVCSDWSAHTLIAPSANNRAAVLNQVSVPN